MWYSLALFVHILGAMGLFSAVGLVVMAFVRMRQASTLEQIREWASVAQFAGKSLMFIALIILAPALYMVIVAWGFTTPWVLAALLTFLSLRQGQGRGNFEQEQHLIVMPVAEANAFYS